MFVIEWTDSVPGGGLMTIRNYYLVSRTREQKPK